MSKTNRVFRRAILIASFAIQAAFAQYAANRYTLILDDPPAAARYTSKGSLRSAEAVDYRRQVETMQRAMRATLASRNIQVTGAASTLENALFVVATPDRMDELKSLPGVKGVLPVRRYRMKLDKAVQLVDGPAGWTAAGGVNKAGAGMKIAILDSGIDQTHPAFQDSSLPMPPGYPICSGDDCKFTSNKVIVARSYVRRLAAGSSPDPSVDSRPDDYSPRDRGGHGTAVASCAAGNAPDGAVPFTGIAPKAYLGNYKIYGSPGVNDTTTDEIILQALEDAINDGMDIVSFSSGGPAFTGALDAGAACGNNPGVPCDLAADAFEKAARAGIIVVAAAGNDGQSGVRYPAYGSMGSPANAPSVLGVGATTNSHYFLETVRVAGSDAPSALQSIATQSGDAYVPPGAISAPVVDVASVTGDPYGCSALPAASLAGAIALIRRDNCYFSDKIANAQNAGAIGVVFYMSDASAPVGPSGLSSSSLPAVMIAQSDAVALKAFLDANPGRAVVIDPAGAEQNTSSFNQLAGFSSLGPSPGDALVKPDLVAVGTSMYMAAQSYDPLGELYSADRFAVADGTSFSTPIVAGAAAIVKQQHPGFTVDQVRSALMNTATQDVATDDGSGGSPVNVGVRSVGAGKLDVGAAVGATVTIAPAALSFGTLRSGTLPLSRQLQITNTGAAAINLTLGQATGTAGSSATLRFDKQSLALGPNATGTVTVTLSGSLPPPGAYSGAVVLQGADKTLRVPYLYAVGSGSPANVIPLTGSNFDGTVNQMIPEGFVSFRVVDGAGLPVPGVPVSWTVRNGGTLQNADSATDSYGIAGAQPVLGSQPGTYAFTAVAGGMRTTFSGTARQQPAIVPGGIANAASFDKTKPVAPGSYISIFGANLSDFTDSASTSPLPLAIDYVNVSFDVPSAGISVPGRLTFVSPGQVNVQVPWELQGQSATKVKVTIDYSTGNVVTVPLADAAPAFFESSPGAVAALDENYRAIGASNPAQRGRFVQLYANGLGPVSNQPATGEPAPASPLSMTKSDPVVTICGQPAPASFSGLAPGFAALYQVNVTVPAGATPGNCPLTLAIGGQTAPPSGILVK